MRVRIMVIQYGALKITNNRKGFCINCFSISFKPNYLSIYFKNSPILSVELRGPTPSPQPPKHPQKYTFLRGFEPNWGGFHPKM